MVSILTNRKKVINIAELTELQKLVFNATKDIVITTISDGTRTDLCSPNTSAEFISQYFSAVYDGLMHVITTKIQANQ